MEQIKTVLFRVINTLLSLATCLPATPSETRTTGREEKKIKEAIKSCHCLHLSNGYLSDCEGSLQSGSPLTAELGTEGCGAKCDRVCTLFHIKSRICGKGYMREKKE